MVRQSTRVRKPTLRAQEAEESRKAEAAGKRKRNANKSASGRAPKRAKTTAPPSNEEPNEAAKAASTDKAAENEEEAPQTPARTSTAATANVTPKRVTTEAEDDAIDAMLALSNSKPAAKTPKLKVKFALPPKSEKSAPASPHFPQEEIHFASQLVQLAMAAIEADWAPELEVDLGAMRADYYGNVEVAN